jgi:hypothetical protein
MLVVGLEDQLHVDLQRVVAADPRRAAAAGQHSALELRSIEAAGIKIEDASAASRPDRYLPLRGRALAIALAGALGSSGLAAASSDHLESAA